MNIWIKFESWNQPEMEFKEFEPRFKSAKIRQNPGLNLVPAWILKHLIQF